MAGARKQLATSRKQKAGTLSEKTDEAARTALELMKQIIALSAGVLALSGTFVTRIEGLEGWTVLILLVSWVLLFVAVLSALNTISAIVKSQRDPLFDWYEGTGRASALASKWSFIGGIAVFAVFAGLLLLQDQPASPGHSWLW